MADGWIVDSAPSRRYPIYTRANVGEVFPEPVAPLTATWGINMCAEPGWRDALDRFGAFTRDEFNPGANEIIGVFGGYCYLNVSISRILGVRTPGLTPEIIDYTFFGEQPGIPPYQAAPTDENAERTEAINSTLQFILTTVDLPELLEEQQFIAELRANRPDFSTFTNEEIVLWCRQLMGEHMQRLFGQHIYTTYASTVPTGIIQQVCQEFGDPTLMLRLIGGVGDVDSAAPSWAMWDLGRMAAASATVTAAFDAGVRGLHERLLVAAPGNDDVAKFLTRFDEFLYEFGSRGPNEWETRSPTWETDPDLALAAIDRMRLMPESDAPSGHQRMQAEDREALGAQLVEQLAGNPDVQGQFAAALRAGATIFLAGRERSKTNAIRFVHEVRMAMNEFGRRMVEAGYFSVPNNYGMLRNEELDEFLVDPARFVDEIGQRELAYADLCAVEPPFVFEGAPPPTSEWPQRADRTVEKANVGDVLQAIPGCPGQATGRARVILDSHDPGALEPGDVLIAPITDPSWTPLFVPAAAVVVDVGAPLSHAIIVSRELGIPCVVSLTDGTKRIPDGALISVDGDLGTVTIVEL